MGGVLSSWPWGLFLAGVATTTLPALLFYWLGVRNGAAYWRELAGLADDRAVDIARRADFYRTQLDFQTKRFAVLEQEFKRLQAEIVKHFHLQNHPVVLAQQNSPQTPPLKEPPRPAGDPDPWFVNLAPGYLAQAQQKLQTTAPQWLDPEVAIEGHPTELIQPPVQSQEKDDDAR